MQLSLEPDYAYLFSYPTSLTEFPIGSAYTLTMLSTIESGSEGKLLEELSRYLMLLLTGWVPTKNLYFGDTRMDNDLVARYIRETEAISTVHGRAILAECKNVKEPLGVSQVGYFLYRMRLTQVQVGILFAKHNISGNKRRKKKDGEGDERKFADRLLDLAFQRDGMVAIAVDLEDIKALANREKTIWGLIDSRIAERRFGKARSAV
jgi:hypothetical protein